jgi:hypothetical protein
MQILHYGKEPTDRADMPRCQLAGPGLKFIVSLRLLGRILWEIATRVKKNPIIPVTGYRPRPGER